MNTPIDVEPDLEEVFAKERILVPYRNEIRQRAFARAKLATPPPSVVPAAARLSFGRQRWFIGAGVAVGLASVGTAVIAIRGRHERASETGPLATGAAATVALPKSAEETQRDAPPSESVARSSQGSAGPVQADEYARELRILEPARRAFERGDFAAVIEAANQHERMFPFGGLAEERDALRVRALFRQHRENEARRAAAAFGQRFPRSVLLDDIGK